MSMDRHGSAQWALAVGALGVVFGDIGTSPLYTEQTVFNPHDPHPIQASTESIFGIVSLIFWSVTIVVTVTYVLLVMHADNDGEGGIMALITLIRRRGVPGGRRTVVARPVHAFDAFKLDVDGRGRSADPGLRSRASTSPRRHWLAWSSRSRR
jgi:KUP system potassium uptake protein